MKIKSIEIKNVKGIESSVFALNLIPNKPNLIVAPNGFGKSSFGIAFQSLTTKRIELNEKHFHLNNQVNQPELMLTFEDLGNDITLLANNSSNEISTVFDIFVINSLLTTKATLLKFGGNSIAKSSMEIEPIVLVNTIPEPQKFTYNYTAAKRLFGDAGKILPDITSLLLCAPFLYHINEEIDLTKFQQVKVSKSLNLVFDRIKSRVGTGTQIKEWINDNLLENLKAIDELNKIASRIKNINTSFASDEVNCFLAAYQIVELQQSMGGNFRKASKYSDYLAKKDEYTEMINSVNSTRLDIKPKEDKKKNSLIISWPKAHEISNGQRDVLSFIALLIKARSTFRKRDCILIVDEIFDYLDDGNFISFQYFISQMIENFKRQGRNLFPIIMTHLDPLFFDHFCFNRHKIRVVYLKETTAVANQNVLKMVRNRETELIKNNVSKYFLHYYPTDIDISADFETLNIARNLGISNRFHSYTSKQVDEYLAGRNYDPIAICIGLRTKIEFSLYSQITDDNKKLIFLHTNSTKKKLDYCEELKIDVPEHFYLLGIIYNDNLHINNEFDITKPLAVKLENITIKKLISDVFS